MDQSHNVFIDVQFNMIFANYEFYERRSFHTLLYAEPIDSLCYGLVPMDSYNYLSVLY